MVWSQYDFQVERGGADDVVMCSDCGLKTLTKWKVI